MEEAAIVVDMVSFFPRAIHACLPTCRQSGCSPPGLPEPGVAVVVPGGHLVVIASGSRRHAEDVIQTRIRNGLPFAWDRLW